MSFMLQSANGYLTMDTGGDVFTAGTPVVGNPVDSGSGQISPTQGWQVIRDPLGSNHYLIVNSTSNLCIGIGADVPLLGGGTPGYPNTPLGGDVTDDVSDLGAVITLQVQEPVNNNYQLWDFIPLASGLAGSAFIQSTQTGYVIELQAHAVPANQACPLDVNARLISNEPYQLWNAVDQNGNGVPLPTLQMAPQNPIHGFYNYIFAPPNQSEHLVGICVTLDIVEDVVCAQGWSLQINCNTPNSTPNYAGPPDPFDAEDYDRDAQWMQFGLCMQNNQLTLFNQAWHRLGPVPNSELESNTAISPPLLALVDNTIPAGTRIIMNLCTDQNDFAIGLTAIALDSTGLPIAAPTGTPIYWPILGQSSDHPKVDGGLIHQKAMAPVGAFQVLFCAYPGAQVGAQFTSGMGTITITASPGISPQNNTPNFHGIATAENSNMPYATVPSGTARLIAQPFGFPTVLTPHIPSPKIGTGLFKEIIVLDPGGVFEVIPGDAPGPAEVGQNYPGPRR
jgi:hypothetical protein